MNFKIEELDLEELTKLEVEDINAGESGWYWLIRKISYDIHHPIDCSSVYTDGSYMFF